MNNLVEVKGHKVLRDLVVLDDVVEVEIDSSKGNLQFIILQMLEEESRHGYQIIKDLEERFKGFYSPSPGSVYPILQMLQDRDFVSISKEGNKNLHNYR